MKKSGFADWNTTTFTDGSASRSVISVPNSTIVVGRNMLIGGLLKVIVHRPGEVRSMLNCERSVTAYFISFSVVIFLSSVLFSFRLLSFLQAPGCVVVARLRAFNDSEVNGRFHRLSF